MCIRDRYHQAVEAFNNYLNKDHSAPRRDALYMLGLSYYQTKVYSKAAETLGKVTTDNDALTQNAYPVSYTHLDVYKRQILCNGPDFQME